ncbi:MAG: peptidylprolyl isomerase [Cellvibrionaceae bacterium]|nr:peptidylprolyl isomerase [Cellvibrionaceae bacterium]
MTTRKSILRSALSGAVVSALITVSSTFAAPQLVDRIAAVVDKDIIAVSSLEKRVAEIALRAQEKNMQLPPEDVLRKQVLDQLVNETLQLTMAKRYSINIPDVELNAAISQIAAQNRMSPEQLVNKLALEGKTIEQFVGSIRNEMMMHRVSQGVVRSRIRVSEQEIDNFLRSAQAQFWISPDFRLGHILIGLPQSPSPEQIVAAEAKANGIYEKLQAGERFDELAVAESSGGAALQGGDLGFRKSSELPTLFAEIAPTLELGEVAAPARSQAGFHILKLIDKKGETKQIVSQVKARHILLKTSTILTDTKAEQNLASIRQDIIDGKVEFASMAKEHSEDIGSKLSGGDLGWTEPGAFVPNFRDMLQQLPIGQLSEPFKSQFGWHVVEVLDRRNEDMTEEAIRRKARELLTSRRMEDETQVWLQELRDDAFIEIKI